MQKNAKKTGHNQILCEFLFCFVGWIRFRHVADYGLIAKKILFIVKTQFLNSKITKEGVKKKFFRTYQKKMGWGIGLCR